MFVPTVYAFPSLSCTILWYFPPDTSTMFDTFGISTGICVLVLFPVPKLPYTFCPHVYTFPSTFNAIPPESFASILTILFMFAIFVNAGVFLMLVS